MTIVFNDVHLLKADSSMLVTEEGMITEASEEQSPNAQSSMLVTEDGMEMEASEEQPMNRP